MTKASELISVKLPDNLHAILKRPFLGLNKAIEYPAMKGLAIFHVIGSIFREHV